IRKCFDGVVFFANSGAEANEGMIKFARKYGNATGRNEIISMEDSFHGRTLASLAATGRAKYRKGFEPDMPGFKQVPFNNFEALKAAITDKTCAILLEPVQGEGGILPADVEYLKKVRALCDEKDILLLFDEVQCGMGRIGTLYAYQSFGVEPDALSMAKAIANGLPMGAFIVRRKHAGVLTPGTHASTFGGTPLVSAAALAVQEAIEEENILENCRAQGAYLMEKLGEITRDYPYVQGVRGKGLMIGIVLDRPAGALAGILLKKQLVVLTAGETVLRLLPPLVITRAEADEALTIIAEGLQEYAREIAGA
ncbi:MAG: acetylornithine transaminase, partial [Lentisphaeria bacterium]|nr:acetylornithine transaminase [Lentisphaeria bacterium]